MTRSLFEELDDPTVRDRLAQQLPFPPVVISFLGRLCLLHGVPLAYLLPDEKLLPPESLKFFFVDPQWIAALVDGALSVGRPDDVRLLQSKAMAGNFTKEMVAEARAVRGRAQEDAGRAATTPPAIPDEAEPSYAFTGFLLRSRILAGWPGLEVRAFAGQQPLAMLRLERPATDLLLGLVDGQIERLEITQPPEGLHFVPKSEKTLPLRDPEKRVLDILALADKFGAAQLANKMVAAPLRFTFRMEPPTS